MAEKVPTQKSEHEQDENDAFHSQAFAVKMKSTRSIASLINREDHQDWLEEERHAMQDHCGSRFVLNNQSVVRFMWNGLITLLLAYTGTIFLFRLCFVDFKIEEEIVIEANGTSSTISDSSSGKEDSGWATFDVFVSIVFWVDLFANFFFTYEDRRGFEVDSIRRIAQNYLSTYFTINLVACIPEQLVEEILRTFVPAVTPPESINQSVRALRLQRVSRLARLVRLTRLAKLKSTTHSTAWRHLQSLKGIRLINLSVGLAWIVHILACGWYLCAALHEDIVDTWVSRRTVDGAGEVTLLQRGPFDQWMHSMYFVLTVFTTVGFGDMSAVTTGEIGYVCFTMMVGAVVHSIIISEVINVVTSNDQTNVFVSKQVALVEAFAEHTQLDDYAQKDLKAWISLSARFWVTHQYDRDEMKQLITGKYMPRTLLGRLPSALFRGKLIDNQLLKVCQGVCDLPPRLPMLMALALHRSDFSHGEIIYQVNDYPFNIFLVLHGTFSYVAHPSRDGGICMATEVSEATIPKQRPSKKGLPHRDEAGQSEASKVAPPAQHPYQLMSQGTYFGDVELLLSIPRKTTARCETEGGSLLTLHKSDFKLLSEEFPLFGARWKSQAHRRETARVRKQVALKRCLTYRHFAAVSVQRAFRSWRAAKRAQTRGGVTPKAYVKPKVVGLPFFHNAARNGVLTVQSLKLEQDEMRADVRELRNGVDALRQDMGKILCHLRGYGPGPDDQPDQFRTVSSL